MEAIPRELFEDSDDEFMDRFVIDRIYELGHVIPNDSAQIILAYVDPETEDVVGVLWLTHDHIFNALRIPFIAVLPEYRDGKVVEQTMGVFRDIAHELGCSRLIGSTDSRGMSQHWRDLGWKPLDSRIIYQEV